TGAAGAASAGVAGAVWRLHGAGAAAGRSAQDPAGHPTAATAAGRRAQARAVGQWAGVHRAGGVLWAEGGAADRRAGWPGAGAKRLVVLDKEGFTPPASWLATDTRTFERDPLVLPKASQVWLEAYEPLPGGLSELALPPDGAVHVGTPDDIRYLLDGWNRPET